MRDLDFSNCMDKILEATQVRCRGCAGTWPAVTEIAIAERDRVATEEEEKSNRKERKKEMVYSRFAAYTEELFSI